MIEITLRAGARRPRLLAVFAFRYDAHLVPGLLENIGGFVDGWVSFDDRAASEAHSSEPRRRRLLLDAARERGAEWVLAIDPDERFERAMAERVGPLLEAEGPTAYKFRMRELYAPDAYRIDGVWGRKTQVRLFSIGEGFVPPAGELHAQWLGPGNAHRVVGTGINLYHLKMITRARREARRDLYNRLDPDRRHQKIGYDYLADDAGAVLEPIPAGREYHPAHEEDGGLWMPLLGEEGPAG